MPLGMSFTCGEGVCKLLPAFRWISTLLLSLGIQQQTRRSSFALPLSPTTTGWQLVNLDKFATLAKSKVSISRADPRKHQECQPIDHPSSAGIGRKLSSKHHHALQGVAQTQGFGDATSELPVIHRPNFEQYPTHGYAETSVQSQDLVGVVAVPGGGCDGKEEAVGGQHEEEARGDGQRGIEVEEVVEGAAPVAFSGGRGHCVEGKGGQCL